MNTRVTISDNFRAYKETKHKHKTLRNYYVVNDDMSSVSKHGIKSVTLRCVSLVQEGSPRLRVDKNKDLFIYYLPNEI